MGIRDVKLKKGMSREEVNKLIGEWLLLDDLIYNGNSYRHNWICSCKNVFQRSWNKVRSRKSIKCDKCKHDKIEQRYKQEVEKDGEYEYIRAYFNGDKLPNGKVVSNRQTFIQVKHKYCGSIYTISSSGFINDKVRCGQCCQKYENSFAHYIEVELGEPLEKYWDFEKNTVNPYHISKGTDTFNI